MLSVNQSQIAMYMVAIPGLEPGSLSAADFKSAEFTNFSISP